MGTNVLKESVRLLKAMLQTELIDIEVGNLQVGQQKIELFTQILS
jgi:hypothetical protein